MQKRVLIILPFTLIVLVGSTGWAQSLQERFTLRISGGIGFTDMGDINRLNEDTNRQFRDQAVVLGGEITRTLESPRWGIDLEGELLFSLSDHVAFGFGAGYLRRGNESVVERKNPVLSRDTVTWEPEIRIKTLFINTYFTLNISSRFSAFLKAGAGYNWAHNTFNVREEIESAGLIFREEQNVRAPQHKISLLGGLGVEFSASRNVGFFIETAARILKFTDIRGHVEYADSSGFEREYEGFLWLVERYDPLTRKAYAAGAVEEEKPERSDLRNVRKMVVDLSGITFKVGIKIGFGH